MCIFGYPTQLMSLKHPCSFTHSFGTMKEGDTSGIIKGVDGSPQCVFMASPFLFQGLNVSTSVLEIISYFPRVARWLDELVDFAGLAPSLQISPMPS